MLRLLFLILLCQFIKGENTKEESSPSVPPIKKGNIVVDELTQFSNPNSFDYDFTGDLVGEPDKEEVYDQFLPQLPNFDLHYRGSKIGPTRLPIVTRKWSLWSTPVPRITEPPFIWISESPLNPANKKKTTKEFTADFRISSTTPMPHSKKTDKDNTISSSATTTISFKAVSAAGDRAIKELKHNLEFKQHKSTIETTVGSPVATTHRFSQQSIKSSTTSTALPKPKTTVMIDTSTRSTVTTSFGKTEKTARTRRPAPLWKNGRVVYEDVTASVTASPSVTTKRVNFESRTVTKDMMRETVTTTMKALFTHRKIESKMLSTSSTIPSVIRSTTFRNRISTSSTKTPSSPGGPRGPAPKPLMLSYGSYKYSGPTFGCRILNPEKDGRPAPTHDNSCALSAPGFSADDSCRCTFNVESRDDQGCPTGFLFSCSQRRV